MISAVPSFLIPLIFVGKVISFTRLFLFKLTLCCNTSFLKLAFLISDTFLFTVLIYKRFRCRFSEETVTPLPLQPFNILLELFSSLWLGFSNDNLQADKGIPLKDRYWVKVVFFMLKAFIMFLIW